jgi:hypothetical protein
MRFDPDTLAERRLMAAVLEDAVRTVLRPARTATARRVREELRWFASTDRRNPFAFERVCEALGIDPSYLRRRLVAGTLATPPVKRTSTCVPASPV